MRYTQVLVGAHSKLPAEHWPEEQSDCRVPPEFKNGWLEEKLGVSLNALFWHLKWVLDHLSCALCLIVSSSYHSFPWVAFSKLPTLGEKLLFSLNVNLTFLEENGSVLRVLENRWKPSLAERWWDRQGLLVCCVPVVMNISLSDLSPPVPVRHGRRYLDLQKRSILFSLEKP